jgi:hypothetical protein
MPQYIDVTNDTQELLASRIDNWQRSNLVSYQQAYDISQRSLR